MLRRIDEKYVRYYRIYAIFYVGGKKNIVFSSSILPTTELKANYIIL